MPVGHCTHFVYPLTRRLYPYQDICETILEEMENNCSEIILAVQKLFLMIGQFAKIGLENRYLQELF